MLQGRGYTGGEGEEEAGEARGARIGRGGCWEDGEARGGKVGWMDAERKEIGGWQDRRGGEGGR